MFDMTKFQALNSATKYPSILTYHALGERGALTEELTTFAGIDPDEEVYLTEKVDGTNSRIVLLPDGDYFIGSREELLYAKGDRVKTPALSIVPELMPVADSVSKIGGTGDKIMVLYFEVYGGKIGGQAKQYSRKGNVGHRLFDVALIDPGVLDWERETIARWRDDEQGQDFLTLGEQGSLAMSYALETVPYLGTWTGAMLPETVEEMADELGSSISDTRAGLDDNADDNPGRAEGLVLRTADRSRIAKARFQDYERTLKRRQQGK